jgi:hypothetical protein
MLLEQFGPAELVDHAGSAAPAVIGSMRIVDILPENSCGESADVLC